jgi:hypothetical protein
MSTDTHFMVYVLLAIVGLFGTGLVLGFIALKWPLLERLAFNSVAMLSDVDMSYKLPLVFLFPPFLIMVGAWYVLVASGRTDPMKDPNDS